MKAIVTILLATFTSVAFSQSKSYSTLKHKFSGAENVTSVKISGLILKTALWIAGENDWSDDYGRVKSLRVMSIPQGEFRERNLSANGFKKVLVKDNFEEIASTFDNGERLTIYLREHKNASNLYFLVVESDKEVTAIEIKGYLNPQRIIEDHQKKHLNNI